MLGKATLFVPGFDHAGISISLQSKKTSGKTRHDLGRQVSEYVSMPYLLRSCKAECFIPATRAVSQGSYCVMAARMTGIE